MDQQQLAARMVCSWGLVKACQQTKQNVYICPPAPHVMEAYNHKVNHDSHKELGPQEHTVLQYARTLQYVSFCNDERHKNHLAPAVNAFWNEVVEPFGSRALHNLDLSHILGSAMCPKQGGQDSRLWGVGPYCTGLRPLLPNDRRQSQYESRQHQQEEKCGHIDALGDHHSPSHSPERRTWEHEERKAKTTKPSQSQSESRTVQNVREWQSCSRK